MRTDQTRFRDVIGQDALIALLKEFTVSYKISNAAPSYVLLTGENGMGKTTIATAFANELGLDLQVVEASMIRSEMEVTGIILDLKSPQVLFLNEIHLVRS